MYYLYRPEHYGLTEDEIGMPTTNLAYIGDLKDIENNRVVLEFHKENFTYWKFKNPILYRDF